MEEVFADSSYWIARINPNDKYHENAKQAMNELRNVRIVTSDSVWYEVFAKFSSHGEELRNLTATLYEQMRSTPNIEIVAQKRDHMELAIQLFTARQDKSYSLTDCTSFVIMEERNILRALTHDSHFEQAGFVALMRMDS